MKKILKKDIVIPAGTLFSVSPRHTERNGEGHYGCTIGLTNDTSGALEYYIDPLDDGMNEWFEDQCSK